MRVHVGRLFSWGLGPFGLEGPSLQVVPPPFKSPVRAPADLHNLLTHER